MTGEQAGRVLGSQHSSTSAFRVVLDDDDFLQLDDLVVVRTQVPKAGEVRTYGVVTEAEAVYEGADLWAQVGPKEFIYGRNVGRNAPVTPTPIPPGAPTTGKWIDVNLTQQLMIA